jgi:hypothetical protein
MTTDGDMATTDDPKDKEAYATVSLLFKKFTFSNDITL